MGSATIRRFAFVAAILLLAAPAWCRPGSPGEARELPGQALVGLAPAPSGGVPAIRRHAGAWLTIVAARADHSRAVAVAGLLALLSLARLLPWATVEGFSGVRSSLGRRRHVIALRAPPRPCV